MSKRRFYSNASSQYGASMGRRDNRCDDAEVPLKFRISRVPATDGGDYDPGGAYWGNLGGSPLWACDGVFVGTDRGVESEDYAEHYIRAPNREAAKAAIRELYPNAKFYR